MTIYWTDLTFVLPGGKVVNRGVIIPEEKIIASSGIHIHLQNIKLYKVPEVGLGVLVRKLNKLGVFLSIKPMDLTRFHLKILSPIKVVYYALNINMISLFRAVRSCKIFTTCKGYWLAHRISSPRRSGHRTFYAIGSPGKWIKCLVIQA